MRYILASLCLIAALAASGCTTPQKAKTDSAPLATNTTSAEDKDYITIKRTRLMERIELALGRPITKYELDKIVRAVVEGTREADKVQVYTVAFTAERFGIPASKASAIVPKLSEPAKDFRKLLTKRLEALLERKLTDVDLTNVFEIELQKSFSMRGVHNNIVKDIAIATGLHKDTLDSIVPKVGFIDNEEPLVLPQ